MVSTLSRKDLVPLVPPVGMAWHLSTRNTWSGIEASPLVVSVLQLCWRSQEDLWCPPEESEKESKLVDRKKVDFWMMRQSMFYVYTKSCLSEGIPVEEALEMFHNQVRPVFPSHLDSKCLNATV
jgi:hypothetical protein